ncbi:MAG: pyruvate carboxylase [Thiotrichales bacterium]
MRRNINKVLVANRGEIAIRIIRAAAELNMQTVAIYTCEDRFSPHRYKADEAYQIGADDDPLKPYLDIETIIAVAKEQGVDAIHPGYGFLSENVRLAQRCREEDIIFVGPPPEVMQALGDKVAAKENAMAAGLPVIENSKKTLTSASVARSEAKRIGYPVMLKAVSGGGGRGMRVINSDAEMKRSFAEARSEAKKAFGDDTVFLEKFIDAPRHIEVQILADSHGNLVHLFERDCSVQRRFQKVVEVAPSSNLKEETREALYNYAKAITRHVGYQNAGTVEFLVDKDERIYFIEVNPRVQVEHTVTENVTGVDIVRSQLHIANGLKLSDPEIGIRSQKAVRCNGAAIQCRITTEDPQNGFKPDYGTLIAYRSPGGFGIRLDSGSAYPDAVISPFFDSLLVKVTTWGVNRQDAVNRMSRALREFSIRGVKTNIGFLEKVLTHPTFQSGNATVNFIGDHPELTQFMPRVERGTRILRYLANVSVNGNPDVKRCDPSREFRQPVKPPFEPAAPYPKGSRDRLIAMGPEDFSQWVRDQKAVFYTDTTLRDAHQSLLATRMRTKDMLGVAAGFAKAHPEIFSLEMWGGATFDVAMRFLYECPWVRLQKLREQIPNILFQMLFRGANAVGYKAYPDNVVERFIEKSWENGIDIFRIFDSLNWFEGMERSIQYVRQRTQAIAEGTICYTGDVLDTRPDNKYNLKYYLDLAQRLEDAGCHMLAVKDMAGLLKPYAATELISALKSEISIPIHLHTHDTAGVQAATLLNAIDAGVDIVDGSLSSMSGLTSQVNLNSLIAAMQGHERERPVDLESLNSYANYWEDVREFYYPFESGLKSGTAEVYEHEIPGGQYSNFRQQAVALGLEHRFGEVKKNYAAANKLFGDIVKVTPSSKVVGDMALYMTSNALSAEDILEKGQSLDFPDSVKDLFKGKLGQVEGGFPPALSKVILKGEAPLKGRPNDHLKPVDFDAGFEAFKEDFDIYRTELDYLSWLMYPEVYRAFYEHREEYGEVRFLPTPTFLFGLKTNEEVLIKFSRGRSIVVRLLFCSEPDETGMCSVSFELNGQRRSIQVRDNNAASTVSANRKALDANEIGAPLQGKLSEVLVEKGNRVKPDQPLFIIEAMKMETTVTAPFAGRIKAVHLEPGAMVEQGDLIVEFTER